MLRLWFLLLCLLCTALPAQQRRATVELEDGTVLQGVVQAMDLATVHLRVDDTVHTLAATQIRSCRFEPLPTAPEPALEEPAAPPAARLAKPPRPARGPAALPEDPTSPEHVPVDLRGRSRWRVRLKRLDALYPWLVPAAPTQWCSLLLVLLTLGSLTVHTSTRVAGAESIGMGRCIAMAAWYLATAMAQMAWAPTHDLGIALMLLGNPTLALFGLCSLFGLSRVGALMAFVVQLGCAVVGYGVLELVTAVLASVGASA